MDFILFSLFSSLSSVLGPGLGSDFIFILWGLPVLGDIAARVAFFCPHQHIFFHPVYLGSCGWGRGKPGIGSCRRYSFFSFLASCLLVPFNGLQPTLGNRDEVPKTARRQDREMVAESSPGLVSDRW